MTNRQLLIDCRRLITGRAGRDNAEAIEVQARIDAALAAVGISVHPNTQSDEWWCPHCKPIDGAGCGSCTNYPKRKEQRLDAALAEQCTAAEGTTLRPIEFEGSRAYIPLPGGWEVQTKGGGSSFRIANTKDGERLNIPESPYLYEWLERMAREIHAACSQAPEPPSSLTGGQGKERIEPVSVSGEKGKGKRMVTRDHVRDKLERGGDWLMAARLWMQSNVKDGDRLLWDSHQLVEVPFRSLEDLALTVAIAQAVADQLAGGGK